MRFISAPEQNTFQEIRRYKNKLSKQILIKLSKVFNDIQSHIFSLLKNSSRFYILTTLKNVSSSCRLIFYSRHATGSTRQGLRAETEAYSLVHPVHRRNFLFSMIWGSCPPGHSTPAAFLSPCQPPPSTSTTLSTLTNNSPASLLYPPNTARPTRSSPPKTPPVIHLIGIIFQTKELQQGTLAA